jgi:hypothetical protein
VESFIVEIPILSKFKKFTKLELSAGVSIACAGVEEKFEFLLF